MAKDQEWKINSTTIENGRIKVSSANKYVKDGASKLTTFTADNLTGRVALDENSSDAILKTTFYSIDSNGYIDFYRKGPNGNFKKYESIQDIADAGILGYNAKTTKLIKNTLQGDLEKAAEDAKIPGPADPDASVDNDGSTDGSTDNDTDKGGDDKDKKNKGGPINASIPGVPNKPSGTFRYPLNVGSTSAAELDRIKFTQGQFKGVEIPNTPSITSNFNRTNDFDAYSGSSVTIGIQPQISDSNRVRWNGSNLNQIQAFAAAASMDIALTKPGEMGKKLEEIATELIGTKDDENVAKALRTYFAGKAVGVGGGGLLSRTAGAVLNPNLELLFEGPDLRQFNYTFKMSAESAAEATQIKNIIKWFKKGMAVRKASGNLFLTTPNVFRIKYEKGNSGSHHDGLNRVKDCALLGCNVNYTPEGNYSTFTDGTMTMYELSLSFGELNPIYAEDYDQLDADSTQIPLATQGGEGGIGF